MVFDASGSLNLTDLQFRADAVNGTGLVSPAAGEYVLDDPTVETPVDLYGGAISNPGPLGFGGTTVVSSSTGDIVGIDHFAGELVVFVPDGYAGGALLASATFSASSFAGLGLNQGTFTWSWGTGPNIDSITLNVGLTTPVPEPSTLGLLVAGLLGLFFERRVAG